MLTAQFNEDVLVVRPEGAITSADVTTLEAAANGYLATHPQIPVDGGVNPRKSGEH